MSSLTTEQPCGRSMQRGHGGTARLFPDRSEALVAGELAEYYREEATRLLDLAESATSDARLELMQLASLYGILAEHVEHRNRR
jgi:hypothetical protein